MKEKRYLIYKHTNKINNKVYIGQTSCATLEKRCGSNGVLYSHSTYFYSAIQKYGWNNFTHEILESNLTSDEANKLEKYYISLYKSNNSEFGYNLTSGGEQNKTYSPQTIEKMRLAKLGIPLSEEHKKNISLAFKGSKHPNYGKHLTQEQKDKISNANSKPIQCVETGIVYKNRIEAAKAVGLKSHRSITDALKDKWRTAGSDKNTKVKYHWIYYIEENKE